MPKYNIVLNNIRETATKLHQQEQLGEANLSEIKNNLYNEDYRTHKHYKASRYNNNKKDAKPTDSRPNDSRQTKPFPQSLDLTKPSSQKSEGLDLSKHASYINQFRNMYNSGQDITNYELCESPYMEQDEPLALTVRDRKDEISDESTPQKRSPSPMQCSIAPRRAHSPNHQCSPTPMRSYSPSHQCNSPEMRSPSPHQQCASPPMGAEYSPKQQCSPPPMGSYSPQCSPPLMVAYSPHSSPPPILPPVSRFLPALKLSASYIPYISSMPSSCTVKSPPPQESPIDFHVPRPSENSSLPSFNDLRKRKNELKSVEKKFYTTKEDDRDSSLPYDLSMRKDKPNRSISPHSLHPLLHSMKLSHCNNGSGYQSNGGSPSGQQGYTGESSYTNMSQMSPTAFFGEKSLGIKGSGGGGDGDDGENSRELLPSANYSNSSNLPSLVEPQVSPLPEHCESLNASDRSLAFPAPFDYSGTDNAKFIQDEHHSSQELIQEISVETPFTSQTQVHLNGDHTQPISSLPLSPPLSCSLSPPSNGVSPTLLNAVMERQSFDSVSSQTQVPLVSSTEIQLSSANWNDKGPLSPPYNGNSNFVSRPPSANGSVGSISDFGDVPFQVRVSLIQQRLSLPEDTPIEFVNGGHGIKNPLISQERFNELEKQPPQVLEEDPSKFVCRVCSKVFGLQRLLNRHMKCHSDLKRYLCTFCGKGFNDTFDLKRHTRTHTGVRPYKCSLCEKSFTQRCSLESHCLKVHGVNHHYSYKERRTKMYVCEECGNTTPEPEKHYVHLKEYHPQSPALQKFYDKRSTPL